MFKSTNLAARVFKRQIVSPRPSASVNFVRQFYENLVPSHTIYDVDCPDILFRKFTDDGQYLVGFSRNYQEVIIYKPSWLSFSCKGEDCDHEGLLQKAKKFDSFFVQLYSVSLGSANEIICKDFFLYVENYQFGLFATSTAQTNEVPPNDGAVPGVPSVEKITFHLVRLKDGLILGERAFSNDCVNLSHCMGVFLYEDLLCIMSLRYQIIHILQIRNSENITENIVDVRKIGTFCQEDDELFLNFQSMPVMMNKMKPDDSVHQVANGNRHDQEALTRPFLSGIKQRLLSFIFRKVWNEAEENLRVQHLKAKFYYHFQDYVDLIMWKVQFLDRHNLLIKFGSVDGVVSRSTDQHPAFFAVYNMETTEIVSFYQNSSEELYSLFEQFYDQFRAISRDPLHANFISSHSNNDYARDQLLTMKSKLSSFSQFAKKMLSSLPYTCQSQSPSPYFDLSLFRYDEKLISATDRNRHSTEHAIKFILRRQPNVPRFKIKPGLEGGVSDPRLKRISSFLFHPHLPFVLSIQQTYLQPTVVNIHFRL